jgi:hypothetical protein
VVGLDEVLDHLDWDEGAPSELLLGQVLLELGAPLLVVRLS